MGNVLFDEEQTHPTRSYVKNRGGRLTRWMLRAHLASNEREAAHRLLAIAIIFILGTVFLFIQGGGNTAHTPPADDPVLLDQTP